VRILEPDLYQDGTEKDVRGPLFNNMVGDLDEDGLKSVLPLLENRRTEVIAQYDKHIAELEKRHRTRSGVRFDPPALKVFSPS